MSRTLNQLSFLKIFTGESSTKLLIPPEFTRKYKQVLGEKFNLETEYDQHSWSVKIEGRNEEHYFTDGWPKFVKENKLELHYLVFDLINKSTFKVSIFDYMSFCEKELPSSFFDGLEMPIESSRFWLRLNNYHKYYMNIPAGFARKARLAEKRGITLVDPRGVQWPIAVIKQDNPIRIQTSTGWNDFLAAQKLHVGSEILIESIDCSKDVFQVKVLKKGGTRKLLEAVHKSWGRGRPPR